MFRCFRTFFAIFEERATAIFITCVQNGEFVETYEKHEDSVNSGADAGLRGSRASRGRDLGAPSGAALKIKPKTQSEPLYREIREEVISLEFKRQVTVAEYRRKRFVEAVANSKQRI